MKTKDTDCSSILWCCREKLSEIHLCYIHSYRCKICCLGMSEDVTHYIGLLHHPWLYLSVYIGALSPVKGTWLPLWAPCLPWRERGCLCGCPVPCEGNMAAPWAPCSPWRERGCHRRWWWSHITAGCLHTHQHLWKRMIIEYQWPPDPAWGCTFTPCGTKRTTSMGVHGLCVKLKLKVM